MKVMHPHLSVRLSRAAELEYRGTKSPEGRLTVKGQKKPLDSARWKEEKEHRK
jgi:hypothetical protein